MVNRRDRVRRGSSTNRHGGAHVWQALPCAFVIVLLAACPNRYARPAPDYAIGSTPPGTYKAPGPADGRSQPTLPKSLEMPVTSGVTPSQPAETQPPGKGQVAVILPLSGRAQTVGRQALMGLQLAVAELEQQGGTPTFVVRDSAGDPAVARQMVVELLQTRPIAALIGAPDARVAQELRALATEAKIPMLVLSPGADLTQNTDWVFRLCVTAAGEVTALVRHAVDSGRRRVGVIHPANPFGAVMSRLVSEAVRARGLQVAVESAYVPGATSFREQVEALRGAEVDAVFALDSARVVRLIAPALVAGGVLANAASRTGGDISAPRAVLLVPSVGFDPDVLAPAYRYLEGTVFSAPFDESLVNELGRGFHERFLAQYGERPKLFAASAYDAARMVVAGAGPAGELAPHTLHRTLRGMRSVDTAGPGRGFLPDGEPFQSTRLAELRGGNFVRVRDAR